VQQEFNRIAFDSVQPPVNPAFQLSARQNASRADHECVQKCVLSGGQPNQLTFAVDTSRQGVKQKRARLKCGLKASHVSARQSPNARPEFKKLNGFDEKVIGPEVEPFNAIRQGVTRGQNQNGNIIAAPPQGAEHFDSCLVGKTPIKKGKLKFVPLISQRGVGVVAVAHPVNAIARIGEAADKARADHRVVFCNQDAHLQRFLRRRGSV